MNIDIDGLIELAKKATPGTWEVVEAVGINKELCFLDVMPVSDRYIGGICSVSDSAHINGITIDERNANAHLIAAASPAVILALCERLREAEKTIQNALSELKAGDVQSAIDQLEAGNE